VGGGKGGRRREVEEEVGVKRRVVGGEERMRRMVREYRQRARIRVEGRMMRVLEVEDDRAGQGRAGQ
jgi:hypothetical protein